MRAVVMALAATIAMIVIATLLAGMTEQGRSVVIASLFAYIVALPAGAALLYAFAWARHRARQRRDE